MKCVIRELRSSERDLLEEFLYQAIFVPEGEFPPGRDILSRPALRVYVDDFGTGRADRCRVAEIDGKVIGSAWARIMDDYGHVDDETPSLAIALLPEWRGHGIGAALLRALLDVLSDDGWKSVSLSVQKANRALKLYERLGFEVIEDRGDEVIMRLWL